jgi:hypothetical protein
VLKSTLSALKETKKDLKNSATEAQLKNAEHVMNEQNHEDDTA